MSEIEQIIEELSQPFPAESLHFRVGATLGPRDKKEKGIALAYIDSRDAMKRLDSVVGAHNWQRRYPWSDGKRLCCEVGIRFDGEWIWKADGAGDTQVEAEKGAFSDAFKRACVNWGIGQYLYDCPNTWYPVEPAGRSYKFGQQTMSKIRQDIAAWQKRYFGGNHAGPLLAEAVKCIEADDHFGFMEVTAKPEYQTIFSKLNTKQKAKARELEQKAGEKVAEYCQSFKEAKDKGDDDLCHELMAELDTKALKRAVWHNLDELTQKYIETVKGVNNGST